MKRNIGFVDKLVRLGIGITIITLHLSGTLAGLWGSILLASGIILILTALISICPIYLILGWTTRSQPPRGNKKH